MEQRSPEWKQARLGEVTASRFKDVLTEPMASSTLHPITGIRGDWVVEGWATKFQRKSDAEACRKELVAAWKKDNWSATAESYLDELLSELVHCRPADEWRSDAIDWGSEYEANAFDLAAAALESHFGETVHRPVGEWAYIRHPDEHGIGCSPDGLIGDDGTLELKCPFNGAKWIAEKRRGLTLPNENRAQVQGSMWVTGRKWNAFCYYDPRVEASGVDPLILVRVERDDEYIDTVLAPRITQFRDRLQEEYRALVGPEVEF